MSPYQSYLDNERIGMAPNAYRPNVIIPENMFTPDSWDLDFPMFEYTSSSRDIFEPTQPPSIGESFPVPSWQTLSDTPSAQTTERNPFSSLPAPPVVPSFHSQITIVPVGNLVRVWNPYYDRAVGPNLWPTSGIYPPTTVPTILPPASSSSSVVARPANWVKIPQRSYNHGSKQLDFKRLETIDFRTKDHPGINLKDAFHKKFTRLRGKDEPMLRGLSTSISCRLLFPGYPDNGNSCQIHTQDWTKARKPISRSKLAHEVARKVDRYLTQLIRITPDGTADDCWRVGRGFMHIDNMFLVSLQSVSKGSFQPEIWVADPSVPRVPSYGNGY